MEETVAVRRFRVVERALTPALRATLSRDDVSSIASEPRLQNAIKQFRTGNRAEALRLLREYVHQFDHVDSTLDDVVEDLPEIRAGGECTAEYAKAVLASLPRPSKRLRAEAAFVPVIANSHAQEAIVAPLSSQEVQLLFELHATLSKQLAAGTQEDEDELAQRTLQRRLAELPPPDAAGSRYTATYVELFPYACVTCGFRQQTQDKLRQHHDDHYRAKVGAKRATGGGAGWFPPLSEWLGTALEASLVDKPRNEVDLAARSESPAKRELPEEDAPLMLYEKDEESSEVSRSSSEASAASRAPSPQAPWQAGSDAAARASTQLKLVLPAEEQQRSGRNAHCAPWSDRCSMCAVCSGLFERKWHPAWNTWAAVGVAAVTKSGIHAFDPHTPLAPFEVPSDAVYVHQGCAP